MDSLSFLSQKIEANQTIAADEDSHPLDWDRLRDANDSYNSILVDPERALIPDFDRFDWPSILSNILKV